MINIELVIFLVVGTLTVLVDFSSYRLLSFLEVSTTNQAKAVGFITGTIFAYFVNRVWTFGKNKHVPGSVYRFAILYASTLGTNVALNSFLLNLWGGEEIYIKLAFLIATGITATMNFIGMKYFVFTGGKIVGE